MSQDILVKLILSFSIGIACSIIATPIFIVLRKIFYGPFMNKKLLEKSKSKGNIIKAYLIKHHNNCDYSGDIIRSTMQETGIYQYEYNGRKYKYRVVSSNGLPEEITLYYLKHPKKATLSNSLFLYQRSPWISSFFLIILLCWLISFIYLLSI